MKNLRFLKQSAMIGLFVICSQCVISQTTKKETFALSSAKDLILSGVSAKPADYKGKKSVRVELEPGNKGGDAASFAKQYISYPDYKFDRLRKESPGKYESYAAIIPGEWIKVKIEVKGSSAKLYINDSEQAVLIVNDLKHGADLHGSIGLWVDNGTEAYFSDLKIDYHSN